MKRAWLWYWDGVFGGFRRYREWRGGAWLRRGEFDGYSYRRNWHRVADGEFSEREVDE